SLTVVILRITPLCLRYLIIVFTICFLSFSFSQLLESFIHSPYTTLFRSRGEGDCDGWTLKLDGLWRNLGTVDIEVDGVSYGLQRSEEHTSELQSRENLVCRLLLEKKKVTGKTRIRSSIDNKKKIKVEQKY